MAHGHPKLVSGSATRDGKAALALFPKRTAILEDNRNVPPAQSGLARACLIFPLAQSLSIQARALSLTRLRFEGVCALEAYTLRGRTRFGGVHALRADTFRGRTRFEGVRISRCARF